MATYKSISDAMSSYSSIVESMNRLSEPLRQAQAMFEPLRQAQAMSQMMESAIKPMSFYSLQTIEPAIESLKYFSNISADIAQGFNKSLLPLNEISSMINSTIMVRSAFDDLINTSQSIGMALSNESLSVALNTFRNSISSLGLDNLDFNYEAALSSENIFVASNSDVLSDHNIKQKILDGINSVQPFQLDDQIRMRLIQIAYSPTPLDIGCLLSIVNGFIPDFENYLNIDLNISIFMAFVYTLILLQNQNK